jgi:hypothetical protein
MCSSKMEGSERLTRGRCAIRACGSFCACGLAGLFVSAELGDLPPPRTPTSPDHPGELIGLPAFENPVRWTVLWTYASSERATPA